jgi:hypothetical protein
MPPIDTEQNTNTFVRHSNAPLIFILLGVVAVLVMLIFWWGTQGMKTRESLGDEMMYTTIAEKTHSAEI